MPTVSACLIVRNEARLLPGCLDSLRGHVDEVCVVDTGSTDRTAELAEDFGAQVKCTAWADDFAAARNISLAMATGETILVIDADERVAAGGERLRQLDTATAGAFAIEWENVGRRGHVLIPRILRRDPAIRYWRAVHESPMRALAALGCHEPAPSGVRLVHLGYDPQRVAQAPKQARNLRILRRWCAAHPGDLYALHKLSLQATELAEKAAAARAVVERLPVTDAPLWAPDAWATWAVCQLAAGRVDGALDAALDAAGHAVDTWPDSPRALYTLAEILRRQGYTALAAVHARRALAALDGADPRALHPPADKIRATLAAC